MIFMALDAVEGLLQHTRQLCSGGGSQEERPEGRTCSQMPRQLALHRHL